MSTIVCKVVCDAHLQMTTKENQRQASCKYLAAFNLPLPPHLLKV